MGGSVFGQTKGGSRRAARRRATLLCVVRRPMRAKPPTPEIETIRLERDLYRRLLELGARTELEPFLEEALALVVEVAGARQAYLELHGPDDAEQVWSIARGFSGQEVEAVRAHVSRGIIAEAMATGRLVDTASALLDPRFADRASVQGVKIEAVLCAPIGSDPPRGVLYLQGRDAPGPFTADDRERARLFARHLAPLADHLALRQRTRELQDATAPFRSRLRGCECVIGRSPALASLLRDVASIAPLDVNVLLTGESGTGKSQIARVIHESGRRAGKPMVEVNCAALPEGLVESELFGALAGSHSTATHPTVGKVAAAEGGTLLLDEIGELPLPAQAKLLQLLQTKQFYPLGASRPETADVRLIAATNADLEVAVDTGRFREDLFYRLAVVPLRVPGLSERRSDVPELAGRLCALACERDGLPRLELSAAAIGALEAAEWPGNVRQLEHVIEAGAIRAASLGSSQIERLHLFPDAAASEGPEEAAVTLQKATRRFQAEFVQRSLEETGWNVSETARRLDVARSHLYRLIRAFGLERESGGGLRGSQ